MRLKRADAIPRFGQPGTFPAEIKSMTISCSWPKSVYVRFYVRIRFGRLELVRHHCRGLPSR
ncbi:hypothetical protein DY251_07775 [Mesorhizobium denitrificans]|uniref:Uncharacterized protein n=1 Tax=Mesorhizobium denitrificans TaxID=2294114 RepID=A0A371XG02_9HYPH|nr:hypothetical protein DY251_07775 [Mesorhizobium denitrificans]